MPLAALDDDTDDVVRLPPPGSQHAAILRRPIASSRLQRLLRGPARSPQRAELSSEERHWIDEQLDEEIPDIGDD